MSGFRAGLLALVVFACGACSSDVTVLRISFRSDTLVAPRDVNGVDVQITSEVGEQGSAQYTIAGPWPQSVVIEPRDAGNLPGSVMVRATAKLNGQTVAYKQYSTAFERGKIIDIELWFDLDCAADGCGSDATCINNRCVAHELPDAGVDAMMDPLLDAGTPDAAPQMDAALPDARMDAWMGVADAAPDVSVPQDAAPDMSVTPDGCVASVEVCNDLDDDCDGNADDGLPCAGAVLLSEVCVGQVDDALDEFVELYNTTDWPIVLDGVKIQYLAATGSSWQSRARLPSFATIPAHGYYLVGSANYSGTTSPDFANAWSSGAARSPGGHIGLFDADDTLLDVLAWGTGAMGRGTPVEVIGSTSNATYERKAQMSSTAESMTTGGADVNAGNGYDSGNNASDFVLRAMRGPQNTSSPTEP